jgi:N-acetylneuraminic acid mutarotase
MNKRLILMTKRFSERLRKPVVRQVGRTTEITERHRGLFLRLGASLCALGSFSAFAQPAWEQLPPLPEPNGGFISGHHDGKIVIVGGTNWEGGKKNWLSGVQSYDPNQRDWTKRYDMPCPIAYGLGFSHEKELLLLGGSDGKQALRAMGYATVGKTSPEPQLPATLVLLSGGLIGERMYFVGGTDDAANLAGVTNATYSLEKCGLTRLADYPGKPFATAASAVMEEELFVFGGMNYDELSKAAVNTAEAYAFSPEKNEWRKLKPLAAPTRGLTAVTLDENHIYIAGGYREDFTAEAVIYDVKADSYRKAISLPYAAMVGLVKMGDHVYCLGGEDKKQSRTDKFFRIPAVELLK